VRVVIAEDEALLRQGLARLLTDAGIDVAATTGDPAGLLRAVMSYEPDVAIVDIRMPPTHIDEGLVAAGEIHRRRPGTGVLVLSHHLDSAYATRLLEEAPQRAGYLLKDRVGDVGALLDALRRIADGECVIDPAIVSRLFARRRALEDLTGRELEVLTLVAEGRSNHAICDTLFLSPKTVEGHIRQIFMKLGLRDAPDDHRRVLAVLTYLRSRDS
jgi:DNA-binding NarL/FixJ family response regulator